MKFVIAFIFCMVSEMVFSQNIPSNDSLYFKEIVSFIRQVRNLNKWNEKIVLINEPERRIVDNWQRRKLLDDSFFSKNDKEEIQQQYSKSKKYKWKYIYSGNTTLVDSSKLMSVVYSGTGKGFGDFFSTYKVNYYFALPIPIFIRNYEYCLFGSVITCGGLCGSMRFYLYKKEKGQWKIYKELDDADA